MGQKLTISFEQRDHPRKRMLAAGAEAMSERASVGARAIELLWECTSQWDEEVKFIDGVELVRTTSADQRHRPRRTAARGCEEAVGRGALPVSELLEVIRSH